MNDTESRQVWRRVGVSLSRQTSEPINMSQQAVIRKHTQNFVQAHWKLLEQQLSCQGNCASEQNTCTDTQATACFLINQNEIENYNNPRKKDMKNAKKK